MPARTAALLAAAAVAAVPLSACGGDERPGPPAVGQELVAPPDAKAVALRGELASLLDTWAFLISEGVRSGERTGFDSGLYQAAEEELEKTTDKLVDALSPLFDEERQDRFARRLARLTDLMLGYGHEQVEPDFSDVPFRREIEESRRALERILEDSSPALREQDLGGHLELTVDELLLGLERTAQDQRGQLEHTSAAAHRARGLAGVLAVAVAAESPEIGDAAGAVSEPARLYADIRTLLEEDFLLSFGAVQVALAEGFDAPVFRTASLQVDESAKLFADRLATIPEVGGGHVSLPDIADETDAVPDDSGGKDVQVPHHRAVRDLLRRHWQLVELYAREVSGKDVESLTREGIERALHEATVLLADVLADQTAIDERETLAEPLDKADKELLKAIEALTRTDPAAYDHLAKSLEHVADAADVLLDGVIGVQVEGRE